MFVLFSGGGNRNTGLVRGPQLLNQSAEEKSIGRCLYADGFGSFLGEFISEIWHIPTHTGGDPVVSSNLSMIVHIRSWFWLMTLKPRKCVILWGNQSETQNPRDETSAIKDWRNQNKVKRISDKDTDQQHRLAKRGIRERARNPNGGTDLLGEQTTGT